MGRLLAGIKELGLDERTLVIFTSDNGALPTFGGERSKPYRGSKLSLYEGGIRMPFIVRWPGHVLAGRTDSQTVLSAVDLFPSFCKLAKAELPTGAKLDGLEMSSALLGKSAERKQPLFWEYGRNETSFAYAKGRDKSPTLAAREGKWKLLARPDGSGVELYDIETDAGEERNLAEAQSEVAKRLSQMLLAWRKTLP
jgi:arylsulfatase A-like enzyme